MAISPEKPDFALITREKLKLEFEVLSDVGNVAAHEFGLVFTLPSKLAEMYRGFGIDLQRFNGDASAQLPAPATFVLDRDGTVRFAFVEVDYTRRAEPADAIAALKKLAPASSK